jgi:MerR family transcriptional regulator/heat shock protein HspR
MRERMEEMNRQMQGFVDYVRTEMLTRMQTETNAAEAAIVPLRRPVIVPAATKVRAARHTRQD